MTEELRPKRRTKLSPQEAEAEIVAAKADPEYVSPLREGEYPPQGGEPEVFPDGEPTDAGEPQADFDIVSEAARIFGDAAPRGRVVRGLHAKLADMLREVGGVQKTGTAPPGMGGFKFTEASHLAEIIRGSLAAKMISMLPERQEVAQSTEFKSKSGSTQFLVTVLTTWRLTDAETGETVTFQSFGSGQDNSDKAFPKAMTNSMKYAHLMGWLVPQGDDPERFQNEEKSGDIKIEASNVPGLMVGGRSEQATEAQIDAIRRRARELNLEPDQLARIVESVRGDIIEVSAVPERDRAAAVINVIRGSTFDQAATIVQMLLAALDPDEQAELAMGPEDVGAK